VKDVIDLKIAAEASEGVRKAQVGSIFFLNNFFPVNSIKNDMYMHFFQKKCAA
jgi:hypothetical protein